jgi:hypothetical protein
VFQPPQKKKSHIVKSHSRQTTTKESEIIHQTQRGEPPATIDIQTIHSQRQGFELTAKQPVLTSIFFPNKWTSYFSQAREKHDFGLCEPKSKTATRGKNLLEHRSKITVAPGSRDTT